MFPAITPTHSAALALEAEMRNYEHENRHNTFAADDVRELREAGEALGKAIMQVKRALDRSDMTHGHRFDPWSALECACDDFPRNAGIIERAAQLEIVKAPASVMGEAA